MFVKPLLNGFNILSIYCCIWEWIYIIDPLPVFCSTLGWTIISYPSIPNSSGWICRVQYFGRTSFTPIIWGLKSFARRFSSAILFVSESAFRNRPFSLLMRTLFLLRSLFIFSLLGLLGWEGLHPVSLLRLCWGSPDFWASCTAPPLGLRGASNFVYVFLRLFGFYLCLLKHVFRFFSLFLRHVIADTNFSEIFWCIL